MQKSKELQKQRPKDRLKRSDSQLLSNRECWRSKRLPGLPLSKKLPGAKRKRIY